MKPTLFLDIDGVLNIAGWIPGPPDCEWDIEHHMVPTRDGSEFPLNLSRKMGERLAALDADIEWLTTWGDDAYRVGDIIGLPENLPVAAHPHPFGGRNWKLDAVRNFCDGNPGHPFVWIDDDAITDNAQQWLPSSGADYCAVITDPYKGISLAQMAEIEAFVERQNKGDK